MSRPMSAHSTHSTDSNATQPLVTGPPQQRPLVPPQAWQQQHPAVQYQQQIMGQSQHPLQYQMDPGMNPFTQPMSFAQANFSFDRMNSPAVSSVEGDIAGGIDGNGEGDAPKKKGSGASQANDQELRRLFRENENRNLQEVANEVKREEKGPKAEKSKQVFGMLWLSQNIKKSTQSVPRNRVYSSYANRCGDDSLALLNPASFGKLVRIIFPAVQTRRLGVRGESKYHYVNLSLVNDDGRGSVPPASAMNGKVDIPRARTLSIQPQLSAASDKAFFPSFDSPVKTTRPMTRNQGSKASTLYLQHSYTSAERVSIPTRKDIMGRKLRWPDAGAEVSQDGALELPRIEQFLPPGTDLDAANSLAAVYRSHCLQAIENFRYCKTDEFCNSFKSLVGLLTVPSQKLLAHPQLAAWVEACDTLKYQRMVPLLRNILLARVPDGAMQHMDRVALQMCSWISQFFANQPPHVLEAMLRPASTFVSMLSRFIRVNRAAHDVSAIFANDQTRDELWLEWVRGSQPMQIVEGTCDPDVGGHHRLLSILTQEAGYILRPTAEAAAMTSNGIFVEQPWTGKQTPAFLAFKAREDELIAGDNSGPLFSRLVRFLEDIPSRFPATRAREIITSMETVMGIAGRNMALNQTGHGLNHFWTVSLFMSEMLYWQAEIGGFLEAPSSPSPASNPAYTSPYEAVNGGPAAMPYAPAPKGTSRPGSNLSQQQSCAQNDQAKQVQNKLLRLEEGFSLPGDASSGQKSRVSLGGETMVGDDDFPSLDGTMDWGFESKDTGNFFGQENPDVSGVAAR